MKKSTGISNLLKKYTLASARAGARSNNRFSFQEGWSLSRLLDVHLKTNDYVAVFDASEDFVIFFETIELSKADFYQIKSREDLRWKITNITSSRKSSKSIVQKLFDNIAEHSKIDLNQYLVLNGDFTIKIQSAVSVPQEFCFTAIEAKDSKKIEKKITTTTKVPYKTFSLKAFCIITSLPLNEENRDQQLKGQLTDFIEQQYHGRSYMIGPIYECLKAEVSRRSRYEEKIPDTKTLKLKKGISKDQLNGFIAAGIQKTEVDEWKVIKTQLQTEGVSLQKQMEIGHGFTDLSVRLPQDSPSLNSLTKEINTQLDSELKTKTKLIDVIESIYNSVKGLEFARFYDEKLIKALVSYEYQKR